MVDLLAKLGVGTALFVLILLFGRRPESIFQRAAGMLLTFPALNGIALAMTETSHTAVKAAAMFPLMPFNGLMFFGYMLNIDRIESLWKRPHPTALMLAAVLVWIAVALPGFAIPPDLQLPYMVACAAIALWLTIGSLPDKPTAAADQTRYLQKWDLVRVPSFMLLLLVLLLLGQSGDYALWTGQLSAFPIPGFFGLAVIASGDNARAALRQMRTTVLLGPLVAMTFVYLTWPLVDQRGWTVELIVLLIPGWAACLAVILAISWVLGRIEKVARGA